MKYEQRDVVEVNFMFPDSTFKPHPALIMSNNELQENEGYIYLCMISTKDYNPQYTFALSDEMLTKPMPKKSYVKCQLPMGNIERDVVRKLSRIRQPYFDQIVEKIKKSISDVLCAMRSKPPRTMRVRGGLLLAEENVGGESNKCGGMAFIWA